MECCKQDTVYDSKNSKINKCIIDPSVKKPGVVKMSTPGVDDVYIMSKKSEASMRVIPDKEVKHFLVESNVTTQYRELRKVLENTAQI